MRSLQRPRGQESAARFGLEGGEPRRGGRLVEANMGGSQSCCPPRRAPRVGLWASWEGSRSGRLLGSAALPGPSCRSGGRSLFIPGVTKRASGKCHQTGDPSPSLDQGYSIPDPRITWVSNTRTPCPHEHAPRHEALPKTGRQKPSLPGDSSPGDADVEGKDRNWWSLVTPKAVQGHTAQHCRILSASSLVRSPQRVSGADAG